MSQTTYREWRTRIVKDHWFEDQSIQAALAAYSTSVVEWKRIAAFIVLLARIIEMGCGSFHLDSGSDFPINDFHLLNHSTRYVRPTPEHGNVAVQRYPSVVLMRKSARLEDERARWTDILTWFEVKVTTSIASLFQSAQRDRNTFPVVEPRSGRNTSPDPSTEQVRLVHCSRRPLKQ